jgi:proline dehydrogenase
MIQMSSNIDKGMNQQMMIMMTMKVTMDKKLQHWKGLGLEEQMLKIQLKSILEGTTLMMGTFTVKGTKEVVDSA